MLQRVFTGFEPFLDHTINPSWELAQQLASRMGEGSEALQLPVLFEQGFLKLQNILQQKERFPDQLWLFGLASNRSTLCLERVALNWIESIYPDNSGQFFLPPRKIEHLQPDAILLSQHPLIDGGLLPDKIKISHSAGTYVCNDLYYRVLNAFSAYRNQIVFVHLPPVSEIALREQVDLMQSWISQLPSSDEFYSRRPW